jgi:hypothetical protein
MTMFIQLENGNPVGYAVTEDNFRLLFPNTFSDSHIFYPEDVEPLGFALYEFTQVPELEYPLKSAETTPVKKDNGIYYQTWLIQEMTDEEKTLATNDETIRCRRERDFRLARTDWTQLPDAQLTEEQKTLWTSYRQALRDVPSQDGFPWNVVWPTFPV